MEYLEKLKDPRWQKKRLEVFNLYHFRCMHCGNTEKELHIHHRKYKRGREPWEYEGDEFFVLCADCHEALHEAMEWFSLVFVTSTQEQKKEIRTSILKIIGLL
jgi:5-methylcytosine-specific restriction endonuclease McrA